MQNLGTESLQEIDENNLNGIKRAFARENIRDQGCHLLPCYYNFQQILILEVFSLKD